MKFLVYSEYAEIADLASHLQNEGHSVLMHIPSKLYKSIGKGILTHIEDWWNYVDRPPLRPEDFYADTAIDLFQVRVGRVELRKQLA